MKKIIVCLLIFIMSAVCAACTKGSSTLNGADKIAESASELPITDAETSKEQNTETEFPSETETQTEAPDESQTEKPYVCEVNTVESLEDDGKEMTAAEALRSAMKGKHSALDLVDSFDEKYGEDRVFSADIFDAFDASEIKDYPDDGLSRINVLEWNRLWVAGVADNWEWDGFVCVDLDNDGTKEVFLRSSKGFVCDTILYYKGNDVYISFLDLPNTISEIYKSGIIGEISGAFVPDYAIDEEYIKFFYKFHPAKGALYRELVAGCWYDSGQTYYVIDHRNVTMEEYNAQIKDYLKEVTGGAVLEWHEFTEENIDRYVVD